MFVVVLLFVGCVLFVVCFLRRARFLDCREKCVFISGCDSGIGQRLAEYFDSVGCRVFAGCLNPEVARSSLPVSVTVLSLDVTSAESVRDAVQLVRTRLQEQNAELWCLINNAGVCVHGEFDWLTSEQCERMVNVNLLGTMRLTKECMPLLRQSKGRVVVIGSVNGCVAYPGLSVYCATKFALEGFCDALRVELVVHGIRVILVRPADMARLTNIMARHGEEAKKMWLEMSQECRDFYDGYFQKYNEAVFRNYGLTSPSNFEDSPLLLDVKKAVFGANPERKYLSASAFFKAVYFVLASMPMACKDRLLLFLTKHIMKK